MLLGLLGFGGNLGFDLSRRPRMSGMGAPQTLRSLWVLGLGSGVVRSSQAVPSKGRPLAATRSEQSCL